MANWDTHLTYVITPKSGPLRRMVRLRHAKQAFADLLISSEFAIPRSTTPATPGNPPKCLT
jgi:hypothetical protein